MSALECAGLRKSYGPVAALDGVDLALEPGTLTALLGPSGCGKSTLLRVIAGFERPDAGTVTLGGRMVSGPGVRVPPERRRAGMVPQEQALFPHLSVAANVAYGLGRSPARESRVDELLDLCGLRGLGARMPHELSGGQQQRVALARALAPEPSVVLLDEPFASLDASLRADLRAEIAAILGAAGQTALLVTHDQDEALSIAATVAVMHAGRIVQHAPPADVYRRPAALWVARFVGNANVLEGEMRAGGTVACPLGTLDVEGSAPPPGTRVHVVVRPEQVDLAGDGTPRSVGSGAAGAPGVVLRHEYHGHDAMVWVELGDGTRLTGRILGHRLPPPGSPVSVTSRGRVVVFGVGPVTEMRAPA